MRNALALWLLTSLGLAAPAAARFVEIRGAPAAEAQELGLELEALARSVGARLPAEVAPVVVVVEPDYVAQIRATGEIGAAVPGRGGELHLVLHRDDSGAYAFALAELLLSRAGVAAELPYWLRRGAGLWLAGRWYGRPSADWIPTFAAAGALPSAAELLAGERQRDSSEVLWLPAAAAVIAAQPGATLRDKLSGAWTPERVAAALARLQAEGATSPPPPSSHPLGQGRGLTFRGVSFAMLNHIEGGYHAPAAEAELRRLSALGSNAVAIMPFAYQPQPDRPEMAFLNRSPGSETDIGCLHAARQAHALGMAVLWKPHLWVSHASWPGEVAMTTEQDWAAWWRSYRRYVLHHAVLAHSAGAELFALGVELDRTLVRTSEWLELIAAVRRIDPGALTYASNWYEGLERVPFWDRLDALGVDAYYPLADSPAAGPAELAAGARQIAARLAAQAKKAGKPLLLTEVGFAARRAAWQEPHREGGELSEEDQAAAYRALFAALRGEPWLRGVFLWKAFSAPLAGARPDFAFLGRRAEREVRAFFTDGVK